MLKAEIIKMFAMIFPANIIVIYWQSMSICNHGPGGVEGASGFIKPLSKKRTQHSSTQKQ